MAKVNNFDVLKKMADENLDIRLAPSSDITNMKKVKAGTQITIGFAGDVITPIFLGQLVGCLLLYDKKQFDELKAKMEAEDARPNEV